MWIYALSDDYYGCTFTLASGNCWLFHLLLGCLVNINAQITKKNKKKTHAIGELKNKKSIHSLHIICSYDNYHLPPGLSSSCYICKWQITMLSLLANVNSICCADQNFNTNCAEKNVVFGCTNWKPLAYSTDGLSSLKWGCWRLSEQEHLHFAISNSSRLIEVEELCASVAFENMDNKWVSLDGLLK